MTKHWLRKERFDIGDEVSYFDVNLWGHRGTVIEVGPGPHGADTKVKMHSTGVEGWAMASDLVAWVDNSTLKKWRTLVRIVSVGEAFFAFVVPGWDANECCMCALSELPGPIRQQVINRKVERLHARIYLDAITPANWYPEDWEES